MKACYDRINLQSFPDIPQAFTNTTSDLMQREAGHKQAQIAIMRILLHNQEAEVRFQV
jgi:hypothetical protein